MVETKSFLTKNASEPPEIWTSTTFQLEPDPSTRQESSVGLALGPVRVRLDQHVAGQPRSRALHGDGVGVEVAQMLQKHVLDIVLEQRGELLHLSRRDRARIHAEHERRYLAHIGDVVHGGAKRDHLIGHGLGLVGKDRNQPLALSLHKLLGALVARQRRLVWVGVGGRMGRGGDKSH